MKLTAIILTTFLSVSAHAELMRYSGHYSVQFDSLKPNYQGISSLVGSYQFDFNTDDIPDSGRFELSGLSIDLFSATPTTIGSTTFTAPDMELSMFGDFGDWTYFTIKPKSGSLESTDYLSVTFEIFNGYDPATSTYTNAFDWVDLNVLSETGYFQGDHGGTDTHGAVFDGTITTQAIPEPSSVVLLTIGGIGVYFTRKRK